MIVNVHIFFMKRNEGLSCSIVRYFFDTCEFLVVFFFKYFRMHCECGQNCVRNDKVVFISSSVVGSVFFLKSIQYIFSEILF